MRRPAPRFSAEFRLLVSIARGRRVAGDDPALLQLIAEDLVASGPDGARITDTGRAHLRRVRAESDPDGIDPFLAQHMDLAAVEGMRARRNESESPLVWLARRKGRDGRALITPHQLMAGERLRAEFTRGQMMPRITANWGAAVAHGRRGESGVTLTEMVISARQRVQQALEAVGPEFSGLLLDVCCFLKKLDDVERERQWPARSGKVVLQLGLECLARHYGLAAEARGPTQGKVRYWQAKRARES